MTAGRFFGFDRSLSARFSLLLAVPAIIGAGRWVATISIAENARMTAEAVIGGSLAFVADGIAITLMVR
jgi:undecaprenyl-diphosphatase